MTDNSEHSYVKTLREGLAEGRISRRDFLRTATLLGVSASAAYLAIGKIEGEDFISSAHAATPTGGDLRIGMRVQAIDDPATYSWTEQGNIARQVCEYLTVTGPDNITRPHLLESWEASEDLKIWTLKLRTNVKWHSGRQLVADDVIWTLNRILDPNVGSSALGLMSDYMLNDAKDKLWDPKAIEKVDDKTVRLTLKRPHLALAEDLFHYTILIIDPAEKGKFGVGSNGTGAFELVEHEVGRKAVLKARKDYWGDGPHLDTLTFVDMGGDPSAQIAALASKQVQGIFETDPSQIPVLEKLPYLTVYSARGGWTAVARVKVKEKPFDDPRVRMAMKKAIDPAQVLAISYKNAGLVAAHHHVHPNHPEYFALEPFQHSVDEAKKLLSDAGYPDGIDAEITCKNDPPWEAAAVQIMVQMWAQANIRVKINLLPSSAYWDVWDKAPFGFTQWGHRPLGIQVLALAYRTGVPWNESGYSNAEFDMLLAKAEGILDPVERSKVMKDIETLLQTDGPIIQPIWRDIITAFDKRVVGFIMHPSNFLFGNQLGLNPE